MRGARRGYGPEISFEVWERLQACALCESLSTFLIVFGRRGRTLDGRHLGSDVQVAGVCTSHRDGVVSGAVPVEGGYEVGEVRPFSALPGLLEDFATWRPAAV